jgi:aspartyl-tRNA(Asn)/glutamyl-tRNA(Gln) amidotransferase subunit C
MSGVVIPAPQANTFVVVSGVDTEIIAEFKVRFTILVSTTKVETAVSINKRVASTFSDQIKDQILISSSATVPQWRRVARLARIAVDDNEIFELCSQLNSIMSFVGQLGEVKVEGVEPMTSVTPMAMKMRADAVTDGGIPDAIIQNAPAREDHFFLVPKVVE